MIENANEEIRRAHRVDAGHQESVRLGSLVKAIDRLLYDLEDLNLRGVDRVPARIRDQASQILEVVPDTPNAEDDELRVRYRVIPLMDVLYRAQELIFRRRDPDRDRYAASDKELDSAS